MIFAVRQSTTYLIIVINFIFLISGCGGGGGGATSADDVLNPDPAADPAVPVVESVSPPPSSSAVVGESVRFVVQFKEEGGSTYQWSVDDMVQPARQSEFVLDTVGLGLGIHTVVLDVLQDQESILSIIWKVEILAEPQNHPPIITSAIPQDPITAAKGGTVTFSVTASDPDAGDALTYSWILDGIQQTVVDPSVQLDTNDISLGNHLILAIVSDGHDTGGTASHEFTLTVIDTPVSNHVPVIRSVTPSGAIRISVGSTLNLSVSASDSDGDPLIYRWSIDGGSQGTTASSLSFTPDESQVGDHSIHVVVDDQNVNGDGNDPSYTWSVTVESLQTPPPSSVDINLAWNPVTTDINGDPEAVAGYKIYVSQIPGVFSNPTTIVTVPSATIYNLSSGSTYYIAVTAYDLSGNESSFSQPMVLQIP